eukprot:gnl/TRDRNA2_/TRDRNA2_183494_c0_seq1.p1 gnl/TRDRNA2_/TRDRNA2_183494_c0~~gnl/TRDRNA2_/TRDRNA2_183494_c0_seq1.p1  ORF type:complete len:101 (-),score=5.63 gnl/TRDRNA2_/TRDRNA2_183494_c0_seq1:6-308(-)
MDVVRRVRAVQCFFGKASGILCGRIFAHARFLGHNVGTIEVCQLKVPYDPPRELSFTTLSQRVHSGTGIQILCALYASPIMQVSWSGVCRASVGNFQDVG